MKYVFVFNAPSCNYFQRKTNMGKKYIYTFYHFPTFYVLKRNSTRVDSGSGDLGEGIKALHQSQHKDTFQWPT